MKSLKSHLNIGRYNFVEWCLNWISRTEIEMQKFSGKLSLVNWSMFIQVYFNAFIFNYLAVVATMQNERTEKINSKTSVT
jgi:hypothetical protein